jgi:NTP pyrophosphatase (non-canonical NTP hydrolase)
MTQISLGQCSHSSDFDNYPGANSFVAILVDGAAEQIRYDAFVALLFKQEARRHMIDHARGGVCEEAGELSSWIKKHVVYGLPLDHISKEGKTLRYHIVEELGDLRFFIQAVMNQFYISEQELLQENANKLCVRYKQLRYSDEAARSREDKA